MVEYSKAEYTCTALRLVQCRCRDHKFQGHFSILASLARNAKTGDTAGKHCEDTLCSPCLRENFIFPAARWISRRHRGHGDEATAQSTQCSPHLGEALIFPAARLISRGRRRRGGAVLHPTVSRSEV